jgi:tetratricopeptide (TPR) repeat protein
MTIKLSVSASNEIDNFAARFFLPSELAKNPIVVGENGYIYVLFGGYYEGYNMLGEDFITATMSLMANMAIYGPEGAANMIENRGLIAAVTMGNVTGPAEIEITKGRHFFPIVVTKSNTNWCVVINKNDYSEAHKLFVDKKKAEKEQAAKKEQEEKRKAEEKKKEEKYQGYISEAENHFKHKDYDKAKTAYKNALSVKPDKESHVSSKIREIDEMQQFLKERRTRVYDYGKIMPEDYDKLDAQIIRQLKTELLNSMFTDDAEIVITCEIDTEGELVSSFELSITDDPDLNSGLEQISGEVALKQPLIKGYTVAAKAEFVYDISGEQSIIKVKKNATGTYSSSRKYNTYKSYVEEVMISAPDGAFSWQFNKVFINDQPYMSDRLLKYKGTGGPSNAILSLLVPGLGDHRVSYGKKSGIGVALSTYALIGGGIGLKSYSNSEYKKYHAAREQSVIDRHYNKANTLNQAFYICVGTGAIIWLSDIIWVWNKGAKNQRAQELFKQSHLGFYYQPDFDATGLTYTMNF